LNLIAEHLNLNEQSSTDYFGVADRYQKARGEELKPDNLNDPNARIIDWAGSSTMKIWNNGRAMLDDNNGNSWMGTMKITGNDSFKIIYDDGEVYRSATNDTVSADEDNMYVNCADSLDEIKDGSLKILKFGCKTDAVVELQKLLGMEEKYQTGYFGPITRKKVKAFQESKNLKADSIVGSKTYGVLSTNPVTATPTETTTPAQAAANTQAATANQTFMQGTSVENWIKDNGFRVTFSDADSTTFAFGDREMIHMEKDGTIQIWRMPVENEKSYVDHGTWTLNGEVINITLDDGFEYTSTSGKWTGSPKTAVRSVATQTTNTLNEGQFIRIKNLMKIIK
jgi:hypothetical protein